jgi:uncharacterized protein with HEPN domain
MPEKRTYIDYVTDIRDELDKITSFTGTLAYEDFIKDEKTVYAVIRCFEIIGEAVKKLPEEIKRQYPEIPWKRIAGMRDKLIHGYFGVDYPTLWQTIQKRCPEIRPVIEKVLKNLHT